MFLGVANIAVPSTQHPTRLNDNHNSGIDGANVFRVFRIV